MTTIRPALRRVLALAILGALLGLVYELLVVPLTNAYEERATEIDELQHQLATFRRMGESRAGIEAGLARLETAWNSEGLLLEAANRSRAGAALQQQVAALVAASGGQLVRSQVLPGNSKDGVLRVSTRVTLAVPGEKLAGLLYELESARPYLLVDSLSITTRATQRGLNAGIAPTPLSVEMVTSGYADLPDEPAEGGG